ncbi:acetate--CoA ligase family protein [Mycobacterium sp. SM1]|uniref:acetate--CoA ligase family protein n=1 Tax=Mycobacterium sp. SM1 TaxID=2816243 RepID=UPI001BCB0734|nr:acetate--CoA ligase family protein [Mycobacterium sp. SM1]MBS4728723.1 acetate--CoA ligase family protein [Mycobacterium sp. SM1]
MLQLIDPLNAVFDPRRVALVGASDRSGSMGELLWRNLAEFPGEVVPVTRSTESVAGRKTYPTLTAVEGDVDLAVVVVPAAAVPGVVREAAAKGVPAVLVISGGFAESGPDGARLQDELVAAARGGSVRIVGPNSFGVQNCDLPLNASMAEGTPPGRGGISLVTQSGAYGMSIHTLGTEEHMRFAKVYAAGNKVDIGDAELLRYLGRDPATSTVCFFLESLSDGRAFVEEAQRITAHKPVIVARTGRSAAGARAAQSHTAALAGSERVWRAALGQAGVILARSGLEMMDVAAALDTQPPPVGPRVGIITNSGGTGVELADLLADEGLMVPELSAGLQEQLAALLPPFASPHNPVDITPVWKRFSDLYPLLVEQLARSGEVDAVVPVLLQRSADPSVVGAIRDAVMRLRKDGVRVPVYGCWVAPRAARHHARPLQEAGVPCFEWPTRTARAIGHAARYGAARTPQTLPRTTVPRPAKLPPMPPGWLDPETGSQLLGLFRIPTVQGEICTDPAGAATVAELLGFPVVAKAVHTDLVHKTDVGAVRLAITDPDAMRAAAADLLTLAPGAAVLVQPQVSGVELLVGGVRDREFGPVVTVALGGVHAEVLDDVAIGLAPVPVEQARRLVMGLRGAPLLTGARGADPVDLDALCAVLCAVGDLLAAVPEVAELDLNPVISGTGGSLAVDWRIKIANPSQ